MEDISRQILSEIKDLKSGQQRLEHSHESLCSEVSSLKDGHTVILQHLDCIEGQQREITLLKAVK